MNNSENILKALSTVIDPDLKKDLVSLNMIQNLRIEGNNIYFKLVLTTPACPLKNSLKNACIQAIHDNVGSSLNVEVEFDSKTSSGHKQQHQENMLKGVKNIIAIASGKGGVGKSTVAANLAVAMAKTGAKVGLVDADIYGPSIPILFNIESEKPQVVEKDKTVEIYPIEKYNVKILSIGFFVDPEQALIWRGPMASNALKQLFTDGKWGELDYLFVDLPPGTGDIHLTLVQSFPVNYAIIVTTPQKVAIADAIKGINMFRQPQINVPVLGLVENMSYFIPEEHPENKYYIFGKNGGSNLAKIMDIPLLGQIPIVQSICDSGDNGHPIVLENNSITGKYFDALAETVAQNISIKNLT